jgi:drug/metabolite transporter (DMT)-like permease
MTTAWFAVAMTVFATMVGSFGALALKQGANILTRKDPKTFVNTKLMFGVFMYALSTGIFLVALKYGELSVLYPITSLTYMWISFLSIKMLGEKMNKLKWVGIAAILLGVTLIGLGS